MCVSSTLLHLFWLLTATKLLRPKQITYQSMRLNQPWCAVTFLYRKLFSISFLVVVFYSCCMNHLMNKWGCLSLYKVKVLVLCCTKIHVLCPAFHCVHSESCFNSRTVKWWWTTLPHPPPPDAHRTNRYWIRPPLGPGNSLLLSWNVLCNCDFVPPLSASAYFFLWHPTHCLVWEVNVQRGRRSGRLCEHTVTHHKRRRGYRKDWW